jgi:hypothetical protein
MTAEREEVLGQGLLRAATRAVNLCFAGVMATSSVVLQSWPLFGVSVAGYATMVAWDLSRLGFWKRVVKELKMRPPPLPDPDSFTDNGARHFMNRLHQARCELRRVLQAIQPPLPARVVAHLEALPEVEKRALSFTGRLEELSRYLSDKNIRGLRNEVERLRRASENNPDPRLRAEYKKAHTAVEEELVALEAIVGSKDLLMAKLETLTGTLETFPCEIVRMQVTEADVRENTKEPVPFDPRSLVADDVEQDDSVEALLAITSDPECVLPRRVLP